MREKVCVHVLYPPDNAEGREHYADWLRELLQEKLPQYDFTMRFSYTPAVVPYRYTREVVAAIEEIEQEMIAAEREVD